MQNVYKHYCSTSSMAFENFDKYILQRPETLEEILGILESIPKPTRTITECLGDMSVALATLDLGTEYSIVGGYAVLAHLVSRFGDRIFPIWRGANDIDMVGSQRVLNALHATYNLKQYQLNHSIKNKYTLRIPGTTESDPECKIDFVLDRNVYRHSSETEEIMILGILIRVLTPLALIKGKLEAARSGEKHIIDIVHLLGVLEHRKAAPMDIVKTFNSKERLLLYNCLSDGFDPHVCNTRVNIGPTRTYVRSLRSELHNRAY